MEVFSDNNFVSGMVIADRYEIDTVIGSGSMGMVLLVRDHQLSGETAALKLLHPHVFLSEKSFSRFQNEVLIMRQLTHSNIVRIYDMGKTAQGEPFITMEYVNGTNLHTLLLSNGGKLDFEQAVRILREIALGMQVAHEQGIVHRDLKPENILITDTGIVKLADFGIARMDGREQGLTATGETLGTPYYMSPEQIREDEIDQRTDIYAFGIIAFELLAGHRPYEGSSFFGLLSQHLTKPLPLEALQRQSAPRWYLKMVEKCCEKDRTARFSSAAALLKVLESPLSADCTSKAAMYSITERGRRLFQKTRRTYWIVIPILVLLVILSAVGLSSFARNRAQYKSYVARAIFFIETKTGITPEPVYSLFNIGYRPDSESLIQQLLLVGELGTEFVLEAILASGVDPNSAPHPGEPPAIFLAIKSRVAYPVEILIRAGANPNLVFKGDTPLSYAMKVRNLDCIGALLDKGDPLFPDGRGKLTLDTLTSIGSSARSPGILQRILSAEPGIELDTVFNDGSTPLIRAISFQNEELVRALLAGSNLHKASPIFPDSTGKTPIADAEKRGAKEILTVLLAAEAPTSQP